MPEPNEVSDAATPNMPVADGSAEPTGSGGEPRPPVSVSGALAEIQPADAESKPADESKVWSVYDVVPADWSQHQHSLAQWKQGDLVLDMPVSWLTAPGLDAVTEVMNDRDEIRPLFDRDLRMTAIICSQTCDIGATPPGNAHPFVLLAPVIRDSSIPTPADTKLARVGKIGYLVRTLPPPSQTGDVHNGGEVQDGGQPSDDTYDEPARKLPSPGTEPQEAWFADLRLIFPASKAILLSREPIPGFADESASLAFAETIALKFRRAALNEVLSEALPQLLRKFVHENGHRKQEFAKVEQVRVLILNGDRLRPARANLYVLTDGVSLTDEERETWTRFQQTAETLFAPHSIALAPMVHADVNTLSAAKYRESVPVRCDLLGPVYWRFPARSCG